MSEDHREPLLSFGDFTVDPSARALHKFGRRLKLHRQPFEVLLLLLARSGEVVTRNELQARLWPQDTFVDFENSLNSAVKKLRRTIGDSASEPRFIETVPRFGYRFIAPIQVQAQAPPAPAEVSPGAAPPSWDFLHFLARRKWWLAIAACAALLAFVAARFLRARHHAAPVPIETRTMLAILPFENLTGDAKQDYLSDGLTEELIAQLEQTAPQDLGVIAPTSAMQYKGPPGDLDNVARHLRVDYILEGSLRRDSQRVRITTQLIRVRDRTIVSARQYDRDLTSLLALQTEIAQEIADEIQLTFGRRGNLSVSVQPPATVPYEAYDLYLKGRYFWNQRTGVGLRQAIAYFQQAIDKDSGYAPAYAGLADSYAMMASYNAVPQNEVMPRARVAALKALQIDDRLAEAHTSLALIAELYDYDWQTAEKEYRRAIQLDPAYATAHHWYAECLSFQGRFDEALAESERARQLDPLSLIIASDNGAILYYSRQYDRAAEQLRSVLDMQPSFVRASTLLIGVNVQEGKFAEALAETEKLRVSPPLLAIEACIYGRAGQTAEAERALQKMEQMSRQWRVDPLPMLAPVYAAMNKKDEAIASLQKALAEHSSILNTIKVDPVYDSMRGDPRFQDLLRRVGLAN